jgi:hypothetical protein
MKQARYIAVIANTIIGEFCSAAELDEYSLSCTDENVFIYRLGTDFLTDGHTEGYLNKLQKKNKGD